MISSDSATSDYDSTAAIKTSIVPPGVQLRSFQNIAEARETTGSPNDDSTRPDNYDGSSYYGSYYSSYGGSSSSSGGGSHHSKPKPPTKKTKKPKAKPTRKLHLIVAVGVAVAAGTAAILKVTVTLDTVRWRTALWEFWELLVPWQPYWQRRSYT